MKKRLLGPVVRPEVKAFGPDRSRVIEDKGVNFRKLPYLALVEIANHLYLCDVLALRLVCKTINEQLKNYMCERLNIDTTIRQCPCKREFEFDLTETEGYRGFCLKPRNEPIRFQPFRDQVRIAWVKIDQVWAVELERLNTLTKLECLTLEIGQIWGKWKPRFKFSFDPSNGGSFRMVSRPADGPVTRQP